VERDLDLVLARFGERIDRVIVEISGQSCEIEVRLKAQIVRAGDSDPDVVIAVERAAKRVARSVSRAIEIEGLVRR
jgi:ribosome-associated translation inhibitor RaiA